MFKIFSGLYLICILGFLICIIKTDEEQVTEINWRKIGDVEKLAEYAKKTDLAFQMAAVRQARRLLSCKKIPPYDDFVKSGIIPILVNFLDSKNTTLQFDSTWILSHIASGTTPQAEAIVEADSIPAFINLLNSPNKEILNQALWGLSHIIDKSPQNREQCIEAGIIPALVKLADSKASNISIQRNIAWTFKNLCKSSRSSNLVSMNVVEEILPIFGKFLKSADSLILSETLSGIANCGNGSNSRIQTIVYYPNLIKDVIPFLKHPNSKVQHSAFHVITVIANGNLQQKQILLDSGILEYLKALIRSPNKHIKRFVLHTLTKFTASSQQQIDQTFNADISHEIVKLLKFNDYQTRIHAAKVIENGSKNPKTTKILIKLNVISKLCKLLKHDFENDNDLRIVLTALKNIIQNSEVEEGAKVYKEIIDAGGVSLIEKFKHKSQDIKNICNEIVGFINAFEIRHL